MEEEYRSDATARHEELRAVAEDLAAMTREQQVVNAGRGLHSFPFLLNLSSSDHRITQLNS